VNEQRQKVDGRTFCGFPCGVVVVVAVAVTVVVAGGDGAWLLPMGVSKTNATQLRVCCHSVVFCVSF